MFSRGDIPHAKQYTWSNLCRLNPRIEITKELIQNNYSGLYKSQTCKMQRKYCISIEIFPEAIKVFLMNDLWKWKSIPGKIYNSF